MILVFGSSSAYGAGDPRGGWVMRLRETLDPECLVDGVAKIPIYNLGISGETSEGLRKRFTGETEARYKPGKPAVFIFAIGGNDAAFVPSNNEFRVPEHRFSENLASLINEAKQKGKVIVQSLTPVNDAVTEVQPGKDRSKANRYVRHYNERLHTICYEAGVPVIDAFSAFMQRGHLELLCPDGVHPNAEGHGLIKKLMLASPFIVQDVRVQ